MDSKRSDDTIWIDVPEKTKSNLEFVAKYFEKDGENGIKPNSRFENKSDEMKVLLGVLIGELRFIETDTNGFEAVEIGEAIDAIDQDTQNLTWNYYAVLRSLEQEGKVIRSDIGEYIVAPNKLDNIKQQLN